ncbi:MAG: type I DNA topoisomerase [Hyphomonadaceae bacterium]|nr:type I DNA topoisomerase [Hyphomonadaceae bacterium]GIK48718.1 MAG: DNA topoisomerase 1 [Alphaproteobacteria bacterium]
MNVVVVESPAKAKTINKYLGSDYKVLASYGHIRDLPPKDGSVKPDQDFAMDWEIDPKSRQRVKEIADALKNADSLILATDPDREGEAISWHVLEALNQKKALKGKQVKRVTFNAITKPAVQAAMAAPRDIDMELVDAYLARRALDYLVGFGLSPVLWRKLPGSRSAGRVQSVALRIIVDREVEIERFKPQEYWSVDAQLSTKAGDIFPARLSAFEGRKLKRLDIASQAMAHAARDAVKRGAFTVSAVEAKPTKRNPPPPFTTSTMQQEAARKLGFNASRTMQTAQRLYEAGHITYMRTDGVSMDEGALRDLRRAIEGQFGSNYTPAEPRRYASKIKNAQEAHEAIRPTDPSRHPRDLHLDGDQARLYDLIWKRAVASQMEAASIERTTVDFIEPTGKAELRATGQVILFDGFLKLYQEGRDDEEENDENRRLPQLRQGEAVNVHDVKADQHFTEPPPRYSEASLVKKLEELGIGRPSTYAAILEKLRERNYVRMDKNRFIPDDRGRLVTAFLENFFRKYVEYDFTADLEEKLDEVSAGDLDWKALMREFWKDFNGALGDISELRITEVLDTLNEVLGPHIFPPREDGADPRTCPLCGVGQLSLRLGKYGAFIGCSNYNGDPPCKYTRPLAPSDEPENAIPSEGLELGDGPNGPVVLKTGRFGPYFETPNPDDPAKPKRASLPRGWTPEATPLDKAIALLSLPREVGVHPSENEMILAGIGRYGPYLQMGKMYANLPSVEDVFEIQMNRAVAVIDEKKAGGGKGRFGRAAPTALKELGESPVTGKPVRVLNGRYGPYINDGETNANVPKDKKPEDVTLDEALALLAARAEAGGGKKKARKAAPKKAATKAGNGEVKAGKTAKKPAAKKATAKKTPAKKIAKKA